MWGVSSPGGNPQHPLPLACAGSTFPESQVPPSSCLAEVHPPVKGFPEIHFLHPRLSGNIFVLLSHFIISHLAGYEIDRKSSSPTTPGGMRHLASRVTLEKIWSHPTLIPWPDACFSSLEACRTSLHLVF